MFSLFAHNTVCAIIYFDAQATPILRVPKLINLFIDIFINLISNTTINQILLDFWSKTQTTKSQQ